jgi:hypothetical protein
MATDNPRLTITLKPSTHAVLVKLSALTKNSQSKIVGELLEQSQPVFERMARVIEAAQRAQSEVKERVRDNLEAAERVLDRQLGLMLGDLDTRTQDDVDELEAVSRRRVFSRQVGAALAEAEKGGRAAQPPAARPPLLTGGSGGPRKPGKRASGRGRKRGRRA